MPITKEQWADIEYELLGMFGRVELLCDGYRVNLEIRTIKKRKQAIVVFIDGEIKGEWLSGEQDFVRKFHRPVKHYIYPPKSRSKAKQALKKRGMPDYLRQIWEKEATSSFTHWVPWWTNEKSFRRHISKTCTDIELVKIGSGA